MLYASCRLRLPWRTNPEQVTRMLAIERSYNIAAIQVGETDDQHFRKPEFFLDASQHRLDFGFVNATAQYWLDLDFDLRAVAADDQLGYAGGLP